MPRILIVDDEAAICSLLAGAFERAGYDVRTASDGPEALALCAAESFDAVLSDVVMPRMNGHELARWIVARHPQTRLVLMSGYDPVMSGYDPAWRDNLPVQSWHFLPKPFRVCDVLSLVGNAIAQPLAS
jgi:DNA-binding NtrC family response regulator